MERCMTATSPYLNHPVRTAQILPWRWERVRWRLLPLSNTLRTLNEAVAIAEAETPHPQRDMARSVLRGLLGSPYTDVAAEAARALAVHFGEVVNNAPRRIREDHQHERQTLSHNP
jgi:hypothetical protein